MTTGERSTARRSPTRTSGPRRGIGAMVVGLVLLAALIAPAVGGRAVAGTPVAVPLAGPPEVGDCLLAAQPSLRALQDLSEQFQLGPSGPLRYRPVPLGPCSGVRFGQVVQVLADPATIAASQDAGTGEAHLSDPNRLGCWTAVQRYLGSAKARFSYWRVALAAAPVLVGPDERQLRSGQHWAACLLVTPTATGATAPLAGPPGSVLTDGVGADQLGSCQDGAAAVPTPALGSCGHPHRIEILAQAYGPALAGVTRPDLEQTCTRLVADLTGKPGLTSDGRLLVTAPVFADGDQQDYGKPTTATSIALCAVSTRGDRTLDASVLGLGARPIPWS